MHQLFSRYDYKRILYNIYRRNNESKSNNFYRLDDRFELAGFRKHDDLDGDDKPLGRQTRELNPILADLQHYQGDLRLLCIHAHILSRGRVVD